MTRTWPFVFTVDRVNSYRTLAAWKEAHTALLLTHRAVDAAYHPRSRPLFDQLRRAVVSIEANIVEGYALNTEGLCRRHLRIAIGSAAEAECLLRAAVELEYLGRDSGRAIGRALDTALRALNGLLRRPPVTAAQPAPEATAHRAPTRRPSPSNTSPAAPGGH